MQSNVLAARLRFRQIRCFIAVARKKSFGQAAEELGLTQPAVSRSVKELEQSLGHALFDRSVRGAALTRQGQVFLQSAEAALVHVHQGVQSVIGDIELGERVRVGALPNVCSHFLPPIIQSFKADHPQVTVSVHPGINADLLASLRRGDTDFVIGRLSGGDATRGLVFEAIFDEPIVFVVRKAHPLAGVDPPLERLFAFPMMLPPKETIIRDEIDRYLTSQGAQIPQNVIETTSSDFQRSYLMRTDCISVLPKGVFQSELEAGQLIALPFGMEALQGPVGLTTNPTLRPNAATSTLLRLVREAIHT